MTKHVRVRLHDLGLGFGSVLYMEKDGGGGQGAKYRCYVLIDVLSFDSLALKYSFNKSALTVNQTQKKRAMAL